MIVRKVEAGELAADGQQAAANLCDVIACQVELLKPAQLVKACYAAYVVVRQPQHLHQLVSPTYTHAHAVVRRDMHVDSQQNRSTYTMAACRLQLLAC